MKAPPLDRTALMQAAEAATGLSNWGDTFFVEALDQLIASLKNESGINAAGEKTRALQFTNILMNRLRTEDYIARHPEILDEEIRVDAVIVGLPRTGSTMLHRLLAADPANTAMEMWEGFNPAPFPDEEFGKPIGRHKAGERSAEHIKAASPDFEAIHDVSAYLPEEEILLLDHCFMSSVFESAFYVPSYAKWLQQTDQMPAYQDLKRFLQFLQWQRPDRRGKGWVLKTPQHVPLVDVIAKVFPGAHIIMTHRDPVQTVPSMCSMVSAYSKPWTDTHDEKAIGTHWFNRLKWNLDQFMAKRAQMDDTLFIDVDYRQTVKDPLGTARMIYEKLGRPFTEVTAEELASWHDGHGQNKHGKHAYSAEQFGLSDKQIAEAFSAYRARYIEGSVT